jgi:hypothetical protein
MTKRKKGQLPVESMHPNRPEMPDMPGHEQGGGRGGARVVVNKEIKSNLEKQIDRLRDEIVQPIVPEDTEGQGGGENKG